MKKEAGPHYNDLEKFYQRLGYRFRRLELLYEAFRHSSYVNEQGDPKIRDNERLEFLGDAVLDLAISDILMAFFKSAKEGDLSKYRATVVNEKGLYQIAKKLKLGDHILLGKGEELTNGRSKPSILANTVEALLGALYLDAGFNEAREVIKKLFIPLIEELDSGKLIHDFKSKLQEYTQETHKTRPEYKLVKETGPAHDRTFNVVIILEDRVIGEGEGKTKKEAEQRAAREALYCLIEDRKGL